MPFKDGTVEEIILNHVFSSSIGGQGYVGSDWMYKEGGSRDNPLIKDIR